MLVVRSKIKEVAKGMNVAGTFADSLSDVAATLIKDAEARTVSNKRSTVMGKDLALCFIAGKKAKEMVVVRSKVKDAIKKCNMGGDFPDHLNLVLCHLIKKACERAQDNKRSTIQPRDL